MDNSSVDNKDFSMQIQEACEKIATEIIVYILTQDCEGKNFYKKKVTNILLEKYNLRDEEIKSRQELNVSLRDVIETCENEIKEKDEEIKKLRDSLWMDQPWDLMSVLKKLTQATDILLHHYDYDDDGWEEVQEAWKTAKEALKGGEVNSIHGNCTKCGTPIELFDSDNDWCPKCKVYKPAGELQKDGE